MYFSDGADSSLTTGVIYLTLYTFLINLSNPSSTSFSNSSSSYTENGLIPYFGFSVTSVALVNVAVSSSLMYYLFCGRLRLYGTEFYY
jgi:hypothetical protein